MNANLRGNMTSKLYTEFATEYDQVVQSNIYNAHYERPSLQALIDRVKDLDVLDLGCGSGIYADYLISRNAKSVTCVDISDAMVALVRNRLGAQLNVYQQDLTHGLPREASNSKDLIICPLMVHYLADLVPFFNEVYRVLKPSGHIVFSTHHPCSEAELSQANNYFATERVTDVWGTIGKPVQVQFFRRSLTQLFTAITQSGLVVTQLTEGQVAREAEVLCSATYRKLSSQPAFVFIKSKKA
ncbi:hypothetical protein PAUR_a1530 [Pseudoalteromonas aurantia 208]|uniref:Methyltransferase type 11 domain-containing protein n=2 Tax=Pseudoalteromonas aurantia TaxID=43654 RepID=A0ABR9EAL4_9GAMM|nr:hypothetical protein [Pseudoalteromonas aurantia 208]